MIGIDLKDPLKQGKDAGRIIPCSTAAFDFLPMAKALVCLTKKFIRYSCDQLPVCYPILDAPGQRTDAAGHLLQPGVIFGAFAWKKTEDSSHR